jgi:nicotinate-nucleotide--dimethylbenzimidazole phosphoribosyltransferase
LNNRRIFLVKAGLLWNTIQAIGPLDKKAMSEAQSRQDRLTKPTGSLGRLEEISVQLAGIQGKPIPKIKHKAIIVMAGDHGVVAEGVSAYPQEVTPQMVSNFLKGGAGINAIAGQIGARTIFADMGVASDMPSHPKLLTRKVAYGTKNMAAGPAMTEGEAITALETGIEILASQAALGLDIVGTGDMGIGNTTASSAICAVITGKSCAAVTGRGTGVDDAQLKHKIEVIERAIKVNQPDPGKPLSVLAKVGGFEIGGLAGVMLGAASRRIPVVVDGLISGAAALVAAGLAPGIRDYLIAGHVSVEAGHKIMLAHLGLKPLVDLEMRLGEGTGAAIGIFLCETAVRVLAEMATFDEAGVSGRSE